MAKNKEIKPIVNIAPSRENERTITVEFTFHAPSLSTENLDKIAEDVLYRAKKDVISLLEIAINQEQKFLDATRR